MMNRMSQIVLAACVLIVLPASARPELLPASARPESPPAAGAKVCKALVDQRLAEPVKTIVAEYRRRTGAEVAVELLTPEEVGRRATAPNTSDADLAVCMAGAPDGKSPLPALPGAAKVAWKHPSGEPVWAVPLRKAPHAAELVEFLGGPTGHRLWSESQAGFTITTGKTHAEAFEWVVENRVKHTYPLTAMRMLAECGNIQEGLCIDVGCGTGDLDIEIARRSKLKIIGLDIDPDMKPLFEKRVREAGLGDRLSFVVGDAQKMPFPDHYADAIISRGTLTFIPDIPKCLKEVHRVLKPTGVAFIGGRYLYTPQQYKISNEKLAELVRQSGVPGAQVIDQRGQWVKIVGPQAPKAAATTGLGPHMLAGRLVADYGITKGACLVICQGDGELEQALQQGLVDSTELNITALYRDEKAASAARERLAKAKLDGRVACKAGEIGSLPFEGGSFDLVAGAGPMLIFHKDRPKAMREVYRVLRDGGVGMIGGRFLHMPDSRRVRSEDLRKSAAETGIGSIRVIDDMGQWVEIRKGTKSRGFAD